jgi:hypothetical protein
VPNILDLPMTKVNDMYVNELECYAEFRAKKAQISIKSEARKGVVIRSRLKSESMLVGINDNYLASVLYRSRSFPIWLILCVLSLLLSAGLLGSDYAWITLFMSMMFLLMFFLTKTARIVFRLADEQDYQILLKSSAVQNPDLMANFIERILMNSMDHFSGASPDAPNTETSPVKTIPAQTVSDAAHEMGELATQQNAPPPSSAQPQATDENGYEWITALSGDAYFRPVNSGAEWTLHEQ